MRPVVNFTEIFGKMFTSQNVQNQIKLSTQFSTSFKSNFPKNVTKNQVLPSGKGTPNCGSGSPWMAVPKKHNIINKNTWISLIQRILAGWLSHFFRISSFQYLQLLFMVSLWFVSLNFIFTFCFDSESWEHFFSDFCKQTNKLQQSRMVWSRPRLHCNWVLLRWALVAVSQFWARLARYKAAAAETTTIPL